MDFDYDKFMKPDRAKCYGHLLDCKKSDSCPSSCTAFYLLDLMYNDAEIPTKYIGNVKLNGGSDYDAFVKVNEYKENVFENVRKGVGVFLYSDKKGNGKTTWACKLLQEYFKQIIKYQSFSTQRCHGVFVNVPILLQKLRDFENNKDGIAEMLEKLQDAELVVWDDIGAEIPTKWVREQLYIIINYRDSYLRSNIYTSNVKLEELSKDDNLGERICDRIKGHSNMYSFISPSKREVGK